MKIQKKNGKGLYLQKRNNRWKWMAGAAAATAGATASQATTITVNLLNNYISATGGNHLNADLTGDGHPDLTIANAFYSVSMPNPPFYSFNRYFAQVNLNGIRAAAFVDNDHGFGYVQLGLETKGFYRSGVYFASLTGSIPLFFKDLHINGGIPTKGSLEVTVLAQQGGSTEVELDSFTYNTPATGRAATLSDQASSLELLAMGAGGILALRRWRTAQGRS
jgi:hypothetical protein